MAKKEDLFYVNLEDPVSIHREILKSTKNTLSSLKRYEAFRNIRNIKIEKLTELKHVMGEINLLVNRLRGELPSTGLRAISEKKQQASTKTKPEKPPKQEQKKQMPKPVSKIEKLEEELDDIESKLRNLE